jgi:hypothetical protein
VKVAHQKAKKTIRVMLEIVIPKTVNSGIKFKVYEYPPLPPLPPILL